MYKDQNGQQVAADNGRLYAFGLGSQKQPVKLRYDVESDELLVAFGRSNEWAWASEFDGFTFSEIDSEGVEIPIATPVELLATRLRALESEAFILRVRQNAIAERFRSQLQEIRSVDSDDERVLHKFVHEGLGSVEQLVERFSKEGN